MVTGNGTVPLLLWGERSPLSQLDMQAQLVWLLLPLQRAAANFLSEPRPQALFSAIFSSVGPFCRYSEKVSLNPSEFDFALSSLPTLSPKFPR